MRRRRLVIAASNDNRISLPQYADDLFSLRLAHLELKLIEPVKWHCRDNATELVVDRWLTSPLCR